MPTLQQQLAIYLARCFPDVLFYKETSEKIVALTIDDAPTPNEPHDESTQLILDAIATHNQTKRDCVRATFFVISSHLSAGTTILDRIVEQGHEIGNHGQADETAAFLSPEAFAAQLRTAHDAIATKIQQPLRWYRPGRGLSSKTMLHSLQQMPGYVPQFALASMLPLDTFQLTSNSRFTTGYATQHIFPGAILLLHGGTAERSQQTAKALPVILEELQQRNYRTVTLSELWAGN
jgi:peptidoglycan-N-acetylglucosamine deacetylase